MDIKYQVVAFDAADPPAESAFWESGQSVRDVAPAYQARGHEVEFVRYLNSADEIVVRIESAGQWEMAPLVRRASGSERDDQATVLAKHPSSRSRVLGRWRPSGPLSLTDPRLVSVKDEAG